MGGHSVVRILLALSLTARRPAHEIAPMLADALPARSRFPRAVSYILFLLVFTLVGLEISLRITMNFGPSSFRFRQYDPVLGVSLIPGREGAHRRCYDGYVSINSWGMRDRERTLEKPRNVRRLAILGDSMLESVHVKPHETAAHLLERKLNTKGSSSFEVLNFAAGGYSTYQEYLRYKKDVRKFDPDVVALVFYSNDLEANLEETIRGVGFRFPTPYLRKTATGRFEAVAPKMPPFYDTTAWLIDNSAAFFFAYRAYHLFIGPRLFKTPKPKPPSWLTPETAHYRYLDPDDATAKQAWEVTEHVLDRLVQEVRRDGAELIILDWGYDLGTNPWWRPLAAESGKLPARFDPNYSSKWIEAYGKSRGIATFDLAHHIGDYVAAKKLKPPYLSFSCDQHFNPQGQRVLADRMFQALQETKLLAR